MFTCVNYICFCCIIAIATYTYIAIATYTYIAIATYTYIAIATYTYIAIATYTYIAIATYTYIATGAGSRLGQFLVMVASYSYLYLYFYILTSHCSFHVATVFSKNTHFSVWNKLFLPYLVSLVEIDALNMGGPSNCNSHGTQLAIHIHQIVFHSTSPSSEYHSIQILFRSSNY